MTKPKKTEPCYFLFHGVKDAFCRGTTIKKCPEDPADCPFYKSEAMYKASLEQARRNFMRRYGYDGYGTFKYTEHYQEDALNHDGVCAKNAGNGAGGTSVLDRAYV